MTEDALRAIVEAASQECPPCVDGPCFVQPCGYHCKYPYTDDSAMWAVNCPRCAERGVAADRLRDLGAKHLLALRDALAAYPCAYLDFGPPGTLACDDIQDGRKPCERCAALAALDADAKAIRGEEGKEG